MEKTKQNPPAKADKPTEKHPKRISKRKCGDEEEPFTEEDFLAALRKVSRKVDEKKTVGN
jgi:hypothetical protein